MLLKPLLHVDPDGLNHIHKDGSVDFTAGQTFADQVDAINSGAYTLQFQSGSPSEGEAFAFDTANLMSGIAARILTVKNQGSNVLIIDAAGNFQSDGTQFRIGDSVSDTTFQSAVPVTGGVLFDTTGLAGTGVKITPLGALGNGHISSVNAFAKNFIIGTNDGQGVKLNSVLDFSPVPNGTMDLGISGTAEWDKIFASGDATIGGAVLSNSTRDLTKLIAMRA